MLLALNFLRDIFSHQTPCGGSIRSLAILQNSKNAAFFCTYVVGLKILIFQPRKLAWPIESSDFEYTCSYEVRFMLK